MEHLKVDVQIAKDYVAQLKIIFLHVLGDALLPHLQDLVVKRVQQADALQSELIRVGLGVYAVILQQAHLRSDLRLVHLLLDILVVVLEDVRRYELVVADGSEHDEGVLDVCDQAESVTEVQAGADEVNFRREVVPLELNRLFHQFSVEQG